MERSIRSRAHNYRPVTTIAVSDLDLTRELRALGAATLCPDCPSQFSKFPGDRRTCVFRSTANFHSLILRTLLRGTAHCRGNRLDKRPPKPLVAPLGETPMRGSIRRGIRGPSRIEDRGGFRILPLNHALCRYGAPPKMNESPSRGCRFRALSSTSISSLIRRNKKNAMKGTAKHTSSPALRGWHEDPRFSLDFTYHGCPRCRLFCPSGICILEVNKHARASQVQVLSLPVMSEEENLDLERWRPKE